MNKNLNYKFYDLLSTKLSGDATVEDLSQLHDILHQHPEFQFLYDEVMRPVQKTETATIRSQQAWAAHYAKMLCAAHPPAEPLVKTADTSNLKLKKTINRFIVAACIFTLLAGTYFLFSRGAASSVENVASRSNKNEMVTPKGSTSNLTLPDGTKVVLNADSKISYGENFAKGSRKVTLSGEAYFDVKYDALTPFIIHTRKADIKVLGTAFNVKNYPNGVFETSLIRGKIEISLNDQSGKKFVLRPSQKFVVSDTTSVVEKQRIPNMAVEAFKTQILPITIQDSFVAETSWIDYRLVFTNLPLHEIATELERYYNIQVTFLTPSTMNYRYTGTFENQKLDEVMKILKLSKNINYKIKNKELIIE